MGTVAWKAAAFCLSVCLFVSLAGTACVDVPVHPSASELVFDEVPCGTSQTQELVLRNPTGPRVAAVAVVTGDAFAIDPAEGEVEAGGKRVFTVRASMPENARGAYEEVGRISWTLDGVACEGCTVELVARSAGAALEFQADAGAFGDVPFLSPTIERAMSIRNVGNRVAQVTVEPPENAHFGFDYERAPAVIRLQPGEARSDFRIRFTPRGVAGPQKSELAFRVDGLACGEPSVLPLSAEVRPAPLPDAITFAPTAVDFGFVDCGNVAPEQRVVFTNTAHDAVPLRASLVLGDESPYSLQMDPSSGVAAADGGEVTLTVTPRKLPKDADVRSNAYGDTLVVETGLPGDEPRLIPIRQTARGVVLAPWPARVNFGTVRRHSRGEAQFVIQNPGNVSAVATLQLDGQGPFSLPAQSVELPAGGSALIKAYFEPLSTGPAVTSMSARVVPSGDGVFCTLGGAAAQTASIELLGQGADETVVTGAPASLTFGDAGKTACGKTAQPRTFSLVSASPKKVMLSYHLERGATSPFVVEGQATLAPFDTASIKVTPKPIPTDALLYDGAYGDVLVIEAEGAEGLRETSVVTLRHSAVGAILAFDPGALSFKRLFGDPPPKGFSISNRGNIRAQIALDIDSTTSSFNVSLERDTVAAGGDVAGAVIFRGIASATATVDIVSDTPLCDPLPVPLELSGGVGL